MTTINTVEDLIRALDENPQWLEILRARILTKEVLELPQRLAEFAVASDRRAEQHAQDNKAQFEAIDRRFDAVEQRAEQHEQANNERFETLEQKMDRYQAANDARFDEIDRHFRRVDSDLGYLKGSHARYAALEDAAVIAAVMGFDYIKSLTRLELYRMVQAADTAGIPANALDSFRYADLIMETADAAGETGYIAVEISFTADARDTGRALRNADFLTRFTGKAAQAAVAGVFQDNEIRQQIESGAVFWHQLNRNDLEAE